MKNCRLSSVQKTKELQRSAKSENGDFSKLITNCITKQYIQLND
jgi:hypothetical protein